MFAKHYRYTPLFVHEHEFFEILCIYDGTAQTTIQGISHTLHTGDICIIPPHTKHSVGVFDDSIAVNILIRGTTFQSTFFQALTADSALAQFFAHVLYRKTEGNYLEKQCVSLKTLAVTGRDLIQAGYKPGPELGEVLKEMLEHVLEEPSDNTKEKLMEFINKEKY